MRPWGHCEVQRCYEVLCLLEKLFIEPHKLVKVDSGWHSGPVSTGREPLSSASFSWFWLTQITITGAADAQRFRTPEAASWTHLWILELLHHRAEAIPLIRGPQALGQGHADLSRLPGRVVKGGQRASVWPRPWPSSTTPRPAMTSKENTLATVHTFVREVAGRELQQSTGTSSRMQVAATPLSTAWGSEERPGYRGDAAYSAGLREVAAMCR